MNQIIRGEVVEASQIVRREDAATHSPIVPRVKVNIRAGTMADLPFIDRMQKAHSRELGFLPTKAIEGKIKLGHVLVAESDEETQRRRDEVEGHTSEHSASSSLGLSVSSSPIGYLIASDRYQKRDEIGYVTQINVLREYRRSLVAASLLQAQFDRSAYGCKLYCCWCAQDLTSANEFWEAMGFAAIAFRTGSRTRGKKGGGSRAAGGGRIHIFWQKRVRAGDGDGNTGGAGATPWWYPSTTGGGEMREDRLVFPIPPGVGWRDVLPVVLPGSDEATQRLNDEGKRMPRAKKVLKAPRLKGGLWFAHQAIVEKVEPAQNEASRAKAKIDPRLTKMARELRDRWTEQVGAGLILPPTAKHDVRRMIACEPATVQTATPQSQHIMQSSIAALPAAA